LTHGVVLLSSSVRNNSTLFLFKSAQEVPELCYVLLTDILSDGFKFSL
ncbi:MAG: hypothetical protein UR27_C0015G0001, partial [Candidatus Peregrinibacteria bacterium GW2011_GWA2_33_10]